VIGCTCQFIGECVFQLRHLDSLVRSELGNIRFKLVFTVDPIAWRFEDWHTRWFRDPYRFMQSRPDGDSDSKPCHFIWVFVCCVVIHLPLLVSIFFIRLF